MKIILNENVKKLGKKGDEKEVADGFARNYLIPKGLAKQASESDIIRLREEHVQEKEKAEHELTDAQKHAAELDGEEVVVFMKANEQGELYASVSEKDIADALKQNSHAVAPAQIKIDSPIKEVGEHLVKISFNDGIEAEIRVVVRGEDEQEKDKKDAT